MAQSASQEPVAEVVSIDSGGVVLKLLVQGFTPSELQLLRTIVQLSERRQPRINLLGDAEGRDADIVMIDAADAQAKKWAGKQPWLRAKTVIWVDAPDTPGCTVVKRPVMWSALPVLLARALEKSSLDMPGLQEKSSGNCSVLVVDDSAAIRAQLRALLEARGIAVTDVDSAEAAIKATSASHFACVLMDVLMPGMDGYEACRRIKANTQGVNRPNVIMLSSKSSPFDRIRGKMAGCDAYLTKPIDTDSLYEVLSRYIANPAGSGTVTQQMPPALLLKTL